mmetsp:Transcript_29480/g.76203  ORF Transcript_29480/g.76203 Transcript_29480/m.76203 type:complete len:373 (+) Transcript_29480:340-1458(+)
MEDVFCYQCDSTWAGSPPRSDADGERLCPECGSAFVEILPAAAPPSRGTPAPAQHEGVPHTRHFNQVVSLPNGETATVSVRVVATAVGPQGGSGPPALTGQQLEEMLQLQPGGAVFGFHFGGGGDLTQVPINIGDFAAPGAMDQILAQLAEQHQPTHNPAVRAVVESLPKPEVRPEGVAKDPKYASCDPGETCSVCHCSFFSGETVTELHCRHCFHGDCILPWLDSHNTCPVCRAELPREVSPAAHADNRHHLAAAPGPDPAQHAPPQELVDTRQAGLGRAMQIRSVTPAARRNEAAAGQGPLPAAADQPPAGVAVHNPHRTTPPAPETDRQAVADAQPAPLAAAPPGESGAVAGWVGRAVSWLSRAVWRRS